MTNRTDAREGFLTRLIDDAGLFPPARLPMQDAVTAHLERREGEAGWMQGRFLCPVSRLGELADVLPGAPRARWQVGAILDGPASAGTWETGIDEDLITVAQVTAWTDGLAHVDAVEVRLPDADPSALSQRVDHLNEQLRAAGLPGRVEGYLELPAHADPEPLIAALAATAVDPVAGRLPLRAKLRCGGVNPGDVPSVEHVAAFLASCHGHGVAFKATAGLHQPLPHDDALTGDRQHGFLGVLGGAVLLHAGALTADDLPKVLTDDDPAAWRLDAETLRWRERVASGPAVTAARQRLVAGVGSCSFDEPLDALARLGLLTTGASA